MLKGFKSFFNTVEGNEGERCHYPTRLDTYGCGCGNNCGYCYAKSLPSFRGLWNPQNPARANIFQIRNAVKRLHRGDIVRLGGMTDCFQQCEDTFRNTLTAIRMLNEKGVHYLIVTKNADRITRPEYLKVLDRDLAHIQISVTNTSEAIRTKVEAGAPSFEVRKDGIELLEKEGFDTTLRLSPFVPEWVDLEKINGIKCRKILVEFLRINGWIEKWIAPFGVDLRRYRHKEAGYRHLPLRAKCEFLEGITTFAEHSVCEDVASHWEYWKNNYNTNPNDCCNLNYGKEECFKGKNKEESTSQERPEDLLYTG